MNSTEEPTPGWQDISQLQKLDLSAMQSRYQELFGKPTKSRNRKQLFAQISKKLQESPDSAVAAEPSSSALTAKFEPKRKRSVKRQKPDRPKPAAKAEKKRTTRALGGRDTRLPKPGTTIAKTYKGKTLHVRVVEKGFEYNGKPFRSLSAVAKKVTGQIWNGFLFFGLTERQAKKA